MTPKKHLSEIVKYVSRQWGNGWPRLGEDMQQAFVRAETLAEISRQQCYQVDPAIYQKFVDELSTLAVQWHPKGSE